MLFIIFIVLFNSILILFCRYSFYHNFTYLATSNTCISRRVQQMASPSHKKRVEAYHRQTSSEHTTRVSRDRTRTPELTSAPCPVSAPYPVTAPCPVSAPGLASAGPAGTSHPPIRFTYKMYVSFVSLCNCVCC